MRVAFVPCVECSGEVLAWAEHSKLLEFMVCVVQHDIVAQVGLKLSE